LLRLPGGMARATSAELLGIDIDSLAKQFASYSPEGTDVVDHHKF
jgi:hypothetical protein